MGGIVGAELLRRNMPIVWGALMAELADPNKVDTTGDGLGDTSGFNSEELLDIRINPLAYDRQLEAEQKALLAKDQNRFTPVVIGAIKAVAKFLADPKKPSPPKNSQ